MTTTTTLRALMWAIENGKAQAVYDLGEALTVNAERGGHSPTDARHLARVTDSLIKEYEEYESTSCKQ